jgi:hypothetical protein
MDLFTLVYGFDYEGETILGIFDSYEKAESNMIEYDKTCYKGIDYYTIYKHKLGVIDPEGETAFVKSFERGIEIHQGVIFQNAN